MRRIENKWIVTVGLVGTLVLGASVGFADIAGASSTGAASSAKGSGSKVITASFKFDVDVAGVAASTVAVTGSAQADFAHDEVSATIDLPAAVAKLIPGGAAAPEVVDVVESGGTVYLQVPSLAGLVGKPWVSVSLPAKARTGGAKLFRTVGSALGDVQAIISFAAAHHATVTSLGTSTIDGVHATGDSIVVSRTHAGTSHSVTADVWADPSDRLVQADLSTTGGKAGVTATVDVSGYGAPVVITVPPAAEVQSIPWTTVESLLGRYLHHGGTSLHRGPFVHGAPGIYPA